MHLKPGNTEPSADLSVPDTNRSEIGRLVGVETTAIYPGKHLKLYRQVVVLPVAPGLHPEQGC